MDPGLSQDFADLLAAFADAEVRYLVINGYAVAFHVRPRFTKDLDLWVASDAENLDRLAVALQRFGAPPGMAEDLRLADPLDVVWMGRPPNRVDLMKAVPGGDFDRAWPQRCETRWGDRPVTIVGREELRAIKLASARPKDLLDIEALDQAAGT
jgi:hypothetical protein